MKPRRARQDGFVLIAAIWFVALLSLLGIVIAGWIARSTERTVTLADRFAIRVATEDAINRVIWQMTSNPFSQRGLELLRGEDREQVAVPAMPTTELSAPSPFVALDDRPYRLGRLVLRLQDLQGLFDLGSEPRFMIEDLLRAHGIPFEYRDALIDRLFFYSGRAKPGINAGSVEDYVQARRQPPRSAPLLTPWEAARVLGWDEYPQLWLGEAALPEIATVGGTSTAINVNTAPAAVLRGLPGFDSRAIANLLAYRRRFLITGPVDIDNAAGATIPYDMSLYAFFPGGRLRLRLTAPGAPLDEVVALRLTPSAAAPYRIDYAVERRDISERPADDPAALPPFPGDPIAR